ITRINGDTDNQRCRVTYPNEIAEWCVSRLIDKAKKLKPFDYPLCCADLTAMDMNNSMYQFIQHMKQVNEADLKYPIILDAEGGIMDGRHRIAKAILTGKAVIKAVRFEKTPEPDNIIERE
ncbi:unnamed protein product, partial [marine sediment metagenome]